MSLFIIINYHLNALTYLWHNNMDLNAIPLHSARPHPPHRRLNYMVHDMQLTFDFLN